MVDSLKPVLVKTGSKIEPEFTPGRPAAAAATPVILKSFTLVIFELLKPEA